MSITTAGAYKGHRFPQAIISQAIWLYVRFNLSYRDVEALLAERGIVVTYETVRQWCLRFGQSYANQLRRRRARPGDKWFLDEVFLTINGETHDLWGPSIRRVLCWISWCRADGTKLRPRRSSANRLKAASMCRA